MIEKAKREYDAPKVDLLETRVEKGFAGSFTTTNPATADSDNQPIETYGDEGSVDNLFS